MASIDLFTSDLHPYKFKVITIEVWPLKKIYENQHKMDSHYLSYTILHSLSEN